MRTVVLRSAVLVLAVALGIAVGAGPLQRDSARRDRDLAAAREQTRAAERTVGTLTDRAAYADRYAAATAPSVLNGVLTGRTVALVALPGADPATLVGVRSLIATGGGRIVADLALAPVMGQASGRQLVEALTAQMMTQNPKIKVSATASGYERFGALLARAIGVDTAKQAVAAYDPAAVAIVAGFETAQLLASATITARAGVVLVVGGPPTAASVVAVPETILRALGARVPTVLLAPTADAGAGGLIARFRSGGAPVLSTVDGAESVLGRVTAVLALAARAAGTVGAYGSVGKVAPVPTR